MTKKDVMTTTIIGIALVVFFFWNLNSTKEKYYKEKYNRTIEATVSTENEIIVFTDSTGNSWEWELEENENYRNNEKVLLVFNTKGTENIEDDILIQINKRK